MTFHGSSNDGGYQDPLTIADIIASACLKLGEIQKLNIPERESYITPWFNEGDMGFIFGSRGLGKTWASLHLAIELSRGGTFGPWSVKKPMKVLYVDGEMALSGNGITDRIESLSQGDLLVRENLILLQHEVLFHLTKHDLSITDSDQQSGILCQCRENDIKVVIFDNLSCLAPGVKENEGDDWAEKLLPFFLNLKRNKISGVIVHHAGRNGQMRGTSRREDQAGWIIELSPSDDPSLGGQAKFISSFTKARTSDSSVVNLEWIFTQNGNRTSIESKPFGFDEQLVEAVRNGCDTVTDLSELLSKPKGTISKWVTRLCNEGRLNKSGSGKSTLINVSE